MDLSSFFFFVLTDQQIGQLLQRDLLYAFQDFAKNISKDCNFSEKAISIPMDVSLIFNCTYL